MNVLSARLSFPSLLQTLVRDRAIQIIAALLVLLAMADPQQLAVSLGFVGRSALGIAPVLLLSGGAAAWIMAAGAERVIAGAFSGNPVRMVVMGALVGALSPFCSCGVIPIITALLVSGVPLAPVMAFWISSPLMDPAMFFVTMGTLGLSFAIAKTALAIGVGLLTGFGTMVLFKGGALSDVLREDVSLHAASSERLSGGGAPMWRFWQESPRIEEFRQSFTSKTLMLAKWLALAFLLESMMTAYVPNDLVALVAGGEGIVPVALAALVGVPAYLNGYAALPLVGGLIHQGMSGGAAMAFLIAGGATSIPAALAVSSIVRPRIFGAYLGFAFGGGVIAGMIYGLIS